MVQKSGQIFLPFCHNSQFDRRTDGQTELLSLDRVCILCSAVKTEQDIENLKLLPWTTMIEIRFDSGNSSTSRPIFTAGSNSAKFGLLVLAFDALQFRNEAMYQTLNTFREHRRRTIYIFLPKFGVVRCPSLKFVSGKCVEYPSSRSEIREWILVALVTTTHTFHLPLP